MAFKLIKAKDEVIGTLETNLSHLKAENEKLEELNKDLQKQVQVE